MVRILIGAEAKVPLVTSHSEALKESNVGV